MTTSFVMEAAAALRLLHERAGAVLLRRLGERSTAELAAPAAAVDAVLAAVRGGEVRPIRQALKGLMEVCRGDTAGGNGRQGGR